MAAITTCVLDLPMANTTNCKLWLVPPYCPFYRAGVILLYHKVQKWFKIRRAFCVISKCTTSQHNAIFEIIVVVALLSLLSINRYYAMGIMYIMATKKWGSEGKNTKHNSPISRQCKCNRIHPRDTKRGCSLYIQYLHVLHICPLILQNSNKQTIFPGHFSVAWIKYKQQFLFVFQPGYGKPCTSATLLFMHPFLPQSAEFNDNIWWRLPPCFPIPQKKTPFYWSWVQLPEIIFGALYISNLFLYYFML